MLSKLMFWKKKPDIRLNTYIEKKYSNWTRQELILTVVQQQDFINELIDARTRNNLPIKPEGSEAQILSDRT